MNKIFRGKRMHEYPICQTCGVNELVEADEIKTEMCRECMSNLMSNGVYCD